VRPLINDDAKSATAVTRDYSLELDEQGPPLLSVFGGKLTTYRKLAEEVLERLAKPLGLRNGTWTAKAPLPGGDIPHCDFEAWLQGAAARYPWLPAPLLRRYARAYGTRIDRLLKGASGVESLGEQVLPGLHRREIDYLRHEEWAVTAEDILWRRSKLGLHLPAGSEQKLDAWLANHPLSVPPEPAAHAS
jgi:glycerol-3-phosphate dehydrogenase